MTTAAYLTSVSDSRNFFLMDNLVKVVEFLLD
jgi:hypothetical protein